MFRLTFRIIRKQGYWRSSGNTTEAVNPNILFSTMFSISDFSLRDEIKFDTHKRITVKIKAVILTVKL
jgi:hypothetical protein